MHICISAKAKLAQIYQCTTLIVGDKYTDAELMTFLGAKLTKDYPVPFAPLAYVLTATPMAVMDALQERGFELKICQLVDEYVTWIMSKPSDKMEQVGSMESQRLQQQARDEQKDYKCGACDRKPKEVRLECSSCGSKVMGQSKGCEGNDVATQTLESSTKNTGIDGKENKRGRPTNESSSRPTSKTGKTTSDHEHMSSSDATSSKSDSDGSADCVVLASFSPECTRHYDEARKIAHKTSDASTAEKKRKTSESRKDKNHVEKESQLPGARSTDAEKLEPRSDLKKTSKEEEKEERKTSKAERKPSVKKKRSTRVSDLS